MEKKHKWVGGKCARCGLYRSLKSKKVETNKPRIYKYVPYYEYKRGEEVLSQRPNCINLDQLSQVDSPDLVNGYTEMFAFFTRRALKKGERAHTGYFLTIRAALDFWRDHGDFWKNVMGRDLVLVESKRIGQDYQKKEIDIESMMLLKKNVCKKIIYRNIANM